MTSVRTQTRWLREAVGVFLSDDRVVTARGEDADTWINGQVTADARRLSGSEAIYALAANTRGRILGDLWIRQIEDGVGLVLPNNCAESLLESFDKHIIMEDVELTPCPALQVVTVQGPLSQRLWESLGNDVDRYLAPRLGTSGFDLWLPTSSAAETIEALAARASDLGGGQLDAAGWEFAHVALGVPRMGVDFGPDSYPQEAGLEKRAVSFQKGCYQGQEAIYMLEKRGKLARRLVQLETLEATNALPGAPVTSTEDGKALGTLTSVASADAASSPTVALAYLRSKAAEVGNEVACGEATWRVRDVIRLTLAEGPSVAP